MSSVPARSFKRALRRTARGWRDPENAARSQAVARTLDAGVFTEEALAFAVNAAMHRLSGDLPVTLEDASRGAGGPQGPLAVVVTPPPEGAPLAGLADALAVLLAGMQCRFVRPEASPALVPAFLEAVEQATEEEGECSRVEGHCFAAFETIEAAFAANGPSVAAAIGTGGEDAQDVFTARCEDAGIPAARQFWQRDRFSVAVLDGNEDEEAREGVAQDALLYEGRGAESVRLLWAPTGTSPDAYLEAMSHVRALFPAHDRTPGALEMQRAFLAARDQSHAHAEGLAFLVSRGTPQAPAPPSHVRWAEYDTLDDVRAWFDARAPSLRAVVAHAPVAERLAVPAATASHVLAPGNAHHQLAEGIARTGQFVARHLLEK